MESEGRGVVAVTEIAIGDKVRDVSGKMVTVYTFGHFEPNATAEYLRVHVQGLAKPLEVSRDHMLFVNRSAFPASMIRPGDILDLGATSSFHSNMTLSGLVLSIQTVFAKGVYAPFTTSGTIVVSGVAASTYVTLQSDSSQLQLGKYTTPFSMHWLSHVYQAPHRMVCTSIVGLSNCRKWERYDEQGISSWAAGPYAWGRWLLGQPHDFIMIAMFLPSLVVALALYAVEAMLLQVGTVLLLVSAATVYFYFHGIRRHKNMF